MRIDGCCCCYCRMNEMAIVRGRYFRDDEWAGIRELREIRRREERRDKELDEAYRELERRCR